jgi:hypothetical protein
MKPGDARDTGPVTCDPSKSILFFNENLRVTFESVKGIDEYLKRND